MTHEDFDDLLRDATASYNVPPEPPREAMWDAIQRGREAAVVVPIATGIRVRRWLPAAAGIAAVLILGITIGRATRNADSPAPVATRVPPVAAPAKSRPDSLPSAVATTTRIPRARSGSRSPADLSNDESSYRMAVMEHLARTEVLLTDFRAHARSTNEARTDAQFASLSHELLGTTRLLLVTGRTNDPVMTRLLQDLELVLMQISQYAAEGRRVDLDAVNQSIERRNVLPKLRSTIPAGASALAGT